jgi:hypothetical protein
MVKSEIVMLKNYAADYEEIVILTIKKSLLADEQKNEELKKLIRKEIMKLFSNDIVSYFNGAVNDSDIEKCVDDLASGESSQIKNEEFWWSEPLDVVTKL